MLNLFIQSCSGYMSLYVTVIDFNALFIVFMFVNVKDVILLSQTFIVHFSDIVIKDK